MKTWRLFSVDRVRTPGWISGIATFRPFNHMLLAMLLFPLITACGMRTMVRGQVVDATSGAPIEGAVVAVVWWAKDPASIPIPLDGGNYVLESYSERTDPQGGFSVPDYIGHLNKEMRMGVYKKGYVCWSNKRVFEKIGQESRNRVFKLKDNVLIELEPLTEDYSVEQHAAYTSLLGGLLGSDKFAEVIKEEDKIFYDYMQKNNRKRPPR